MTKELSEDSKFKISIKTLLWIVAGVATVIAGYYGMLSNIIWITWSVMSNSLFMLVMCIVFTALHIRNYFHMRKIK